MSCNIVRVYLSTLKVNTATEQVCTCFCKSKEHKMTLTQAQPKTKPALGWRSVSIHHVPLTMRLNFPNHLIRVALSEERSDHTIHWIAAWEQTWRWTIHSNQVCLPRYFYFTDSFLWLCVPALPYKGEAVPLKALICMLEWLPKRFTLRAPWRQRPADVTCFFSGLLWNLLNCVVTS